MTMRDESDADNGSAQDDSRPSHPVVLLGEIHLIAEDTGNLTELMLILSVFYCPLQGNTSSELDQKPLHPFKFSAFY